MLPMRRMLRMLQTRNAARSAAPRSASRTAPNALPAQSASVPPSDHILRNANVLKNARVLQNVRALHIANGPRSEPIHPKANAGQDQAARAPQRGLDGAAKKSGRHHVRSAARPGAIRAAGHD